MTRVVYSRHYNIGLYGLERLHPFDSRKYGRAWKKICRHFGSSMRQLHVRPMCPANREELLLVHTVKYLDQLRDPRYVAGALEVPQIGYLPGWAIDRHVLRPMRWATYGTILAAQEALQHGFAVNLSGGYHHAKPDRGEGFSIYSDVGIAVVSARINNLISDTTGSCTNAEYLGKLSDRLPGFLDSVCNSSVGLAIYNAGTDVFDGDPLGGLSISAETIRKRDLYVVGELRKREIPTVMVLSGGYTKQSFQLVADSVIAIVEMGSTS